MALSNKPKKSKYQVGDTVFFLSSRKGTQAQIIKVSSSVSNPDNDANGIQENIYYLQGFVKGFAETELFHSMNALMFEIKGSYLHKWGNSDNVLLQAGDLLTYCDFSYSLLSENTGLPNNFIGIDFSLCNFDGCKLEGATFSGSNLSSCSFRFANLHGTSFGEANISLCDFRNTNLTNSGLPATANTKSSFKSTVGDGHWDAETTIWIDGNPIG